VAVATPTNAQADEICRRLTRDHPRTACVRFAADGMSAPAGWPTAVTWVTDTGALPTRPAVVVATAAKWGLVNLAHPFDILFLDEAWQLSWADFMLLGQVAGRFVLIGDPGQIPPVVTIDVSRWETAPRPPHRAAPEVILADPTIPVLRFSLPATRRLPYDTAGLIRPFYDFEFGSWAGPGERRVRARRNSRGAVDKAIDLLEGASTVGYMMPTPPGGPPLEKDDEVAEIAVEIVNRLLGREAVVQVDGKEDALRPDDIGICATHRVMNTAIELRLPVASRRRVRVDTPERWQGLERMVMVIVHPLSGVTRPSPFDLDTGRLCVMASRHKAGVILLTRDHLSQTLRDHLPVADQAVGRPDACGIGHARNLALWTELENRSRVVAA